MPRVTRCALVFLSLLIAAAAAHAQDPVSPLPDPVPPPLLDEPIGGFVIDARGVMARMKGTSSLAPTLGVAKTDMPTRGWGLAVGAHVYPLHKGNVALGVGGEMLLRARASCTKPSAVADGPDGPTVVTRMTSISPQVSLNFGKRNGWSYLSGGIGKGSFTSELDDTPFEPAESRPRSINYGGGARWFTNQHLAFTFDIRFYTTAAQAVAVGRPAFPQTRVLVLSAGISAR